MFGLNSVPNPQNASHYAVVEDGKLWQISHWSDGGDFDGPREPGFFIYRPEIQNPYTGDTYDPVNGYLYYIVFSKQQTLPDG
jgi:hypothetical protein